MREGDFWGLGKFLSARVNPSCYVVVTCTVTNSIHFVMPRGRLMYLQQCPFRLRLIQFVLSGNIDRYGLQQ